MESYGQDPMAPVRCLFCHKCCSAAHAWGQRLKDLFAKANVVLLVDPFGVGDEIDRRVETLDFHALLFLCSSASLSSQECNFERAVAERRKVPAFAVLDGVEMPRELSYRLSLSLSDPAVAQEKAWLDLARSIRERAQLYRLIQQLDPRNTPECVRKTAQTIAFFENRTAVSEMTEVLGEFYVPETDPTARYWIAISLGYGGGVPAQKLLASFLRWEREPYPAQGLREALQEMALRDGS